MDNSALPIGLVPRFFQEALETTMTSYDLEPLDSNATFRFACDAEVPCFNACCRDLQQVLTPHDVLILRSYLGLSWKEFVARYAQLGTGPSTGLPVVTLRFDTQPEAACPFVAEGGCRVYPARPASCRLYPLARAVGRRPDDGCLTEHFALIREPHCRGFEHGPQRTVRQWIDDQELTDFLQANDRLLELIALKNRYRRGPLPPSRQQLMVMALYDFDTLKQYAEQNRLGACVIPPSHALPEKQNDSTWLAWGETWARQILSSDAPDRHPGGGRRACP